MKPRYRVKQKQLMLNTCGKNSGWIIYTFYKVINSNLTYIDWILK